MIPTLCMQIPTTLLQKNLRIANECLLYWAFNIAVSDLFKKNSLVIQGCSLEAKYLTPYRHELMV